MRRRDSLTKAQSFVEYAVVIAVVAAAMVGGKIYFTRAVMEKHRQGADVLGQGEQYALGVTAETDSSPPGVDYGGVTLNDAAEVDCDAVNSRVDTLQRTVDSLRTQANTLEQSAATIEVVNSGGAETLRDRVRVFRAEADEKEAEIAQYRIDYPDCF